ncbi:MAG TPA: lipopolysaccharide transport periplasmic protein LptA [Geobacteraceae bacterium]
MSRVLSLVIAVLCLTALAVGAERPVGGRDQQPIQIKSDQLLADNAKRSATFSGNVIARQGDLLIYADKLVVFYGENNGGVTRAEVTGNVRIVQGDRQGRADHGIYDSAAGTIVLDGKPQVFQGNDIITGTVITYFLEEQKSVVTGGPGNRVEAVIHPREKDKDGRPKP